MIMIASSRLWPVLPILIAAVLLCPASARGAHIDIDDPTLLGHVLPRIAVDTPTAAPRLPSPISVQLSSPFQSGDPATY
jgi:hypothetical protein